MKGITKTTKVVYLFLLDNLIIIFLKIIYENLDILSGSGRGELVEIHSNCFFL